MPTPANKNILYRMLCPPLQYPINIAGYAHPCNKHFILLPVSIIHPLQYAFFITAFTPVIYTKLKMLSFYRRVQHPFHLFISQVMLTPAVCILITGYAHLCNTHFISQVMPTSAVHILDITGYAHPCSTHFI